MEFDELKQLVESNAKSIEALSNESAAARQELTEGLKKLEQLLIATPKLFSDWLKQQGLIGKTFVTSKIQSLPLLRWVRPRKTPNSISGLLNYW